MHRSGEFLGEDPVDPSLHRDAGLARKRWRAQDNPEMCLAARSRTRVSGVKRRLVDNF